MLLISLIILAVLLASGAALVRSFDTSLFQAGNLAFKRDLANQVELVTPVVLGRFQGTAAAGTLPLLNTTALRSANTTGYSATMLPSNAQGIPNDLLIAAPAVAPVVNAPAGQGVSISYLIDRMCMNVGDETALADEKCVRVYECERSGAASSYGCVGKSHVSYRVSVRVDGPRNTQGFFQTVLSVPTP